MKNLILTIFLSTFILHGACTQKVPSPAPSPSQAPSSSASQDSAFGSVACDSGWKDAFAPKIASLLPPELLNLDPKRMDQALCPNYAKVDKQAFWIALSRAVIENESGYNRCAIYQENMGLDDVTGRPVLSEGWWQLSYQDGSSYGIPECSFGWPKWKQALDDDFSAKSDGSRSWGTKHPEQTIMDPAANTICAFKIMVADLKRDTSKSFEEATGEYWWTLENHHDSKESQNHDCGVRQTLSGIFPACGTKVSDCE